MRRQICLAFALFNLLMLAGALHITAQVNRVAYLAVTDVQPSPAGQLGLRDTVTFWFNRRVDCADAEAALSWQPATRGVLSCDEYSVSFAPDGAFQRDQRYTFRLQTPLAAKDGAPLLDPFHVVFSTVGFLTIADAFPLPGSSLAGVDSAISVAFDAPVVPLALSPDRGDLPQPLTLSPAVAGLGEWVNSAVYIFRPSQPLDGDTEYTVTISPDLAAVDGSVMGSAAAWTFETAPPAIVAINPPPGSNDLILNPQIQIRFDQPLSQELVERAFRFQAQPASNDPDLGGVFAWADDGLGFAYVPERRLALDMVYRASFDGELLPSLRIAGASQVPSWFYTTVGPPRIIDTEPQDGEQDAYTHGLSLYFASPMDIDSLAGKVRIEPAPAEAPITYYSDWNNRYAVSFDARPDTNYRVTVAAGMQDIYGNAIAEPLTIAYKTEPRPPEIGFVSPSAVGFYNAHQPPTRLRFHHRGVEHVDLALYRIKLDDFVARMTDPEFWSPAQDFQPPSDSLIESWRFAGRADGKRQDEIVTLANEGLAPGIYYAELSAPGLDTRWASARKFLKVSTAALTMKQSADSLLIWAVDVGTGLPLAGETVRVFGEGSALVATGITDAMGLANIVLPSSLRSFASLAVALDTDEQFGFGMSTWSEGMLPWDFGLDTGRFQGKYPIYVYTDRPVYRGGQTVYFRGLARVKDDLRYTPTRMDSVSVSFRDSQYDIAGELELPLSETGSFHGEFDLPAEASPGAWTLLVKLPTDSEYEEDGFIDFQVAEYRLPEFQVLLTTDQPQIAQGGAADFEIAGRYFFGGAVSDAQAEYSVVSAAYRFTYQGDGDYDFGVREPFQYGWSPFDLDEGLLYEGELRTDAAGVARFELHGDLGDARGSRRFMIDAAISDESGQAIFDQGSLVVHQGLLYIGARAEEAVGRAEEDSRINLIAVDWDSQPIANQQIDIEIVERRWTSEQTQDPISGRVETTWQMTEIPVTSGRLVSDMDGEADFVFQPPSAGLYKILAASVDSAGNEVTTVTYAWIAGDGFVPWGGGSDDDIQIDLVPGKRAYRVGDRAKVLITSPYAGETQALIAIERGDVLHAEVLSINGSSHVYEFDVLPEHAPNIYVSVFLMKAADENYAVASWRMGVAELEVDAERYALKIDIRPDKRIAAPQDTIRYDLQASDYQGEPVSAEVGVALTDLAALSLAERNSPQLLDHFYGAQPLLVQTSSSLLRSEPQARAVAESMSMLDSCCFGGGGGFADPGIIDLRSKFIDTPYWNPLLVTDSAGKATFETRLPDNLATWRLDARAWTKSPAGQLLLGENTSDLRSARPLLIRPITPRFFVVGDRARLSAIVNNNSEAQLSASVSMTNLAGLELANGESNQRRISIPAGGRARMTWQVTIGDVEAVAPIFTVRSDDDSFSDASISPVSIDDDGSLPVVRFAASETIGTAGLLREAGMRLEALRLPGDLDLQRGSLDIRLQKSLAGMLTESLTYLETETARHRDCAASLVSRFLPNIVSYRALNQVGLADAALKARLDALIAEALLELAERQLGDGGWSWCSGDRSDTMTTAYALYGLATARQQGYFVEAAAVNRAQRHLQRALINPSLADETWQLNRQAFLLYALAMSGAPDIDHSAELFSSRQRLNLDAVAFLAQTLYSIDSQDETRLDALAQQLLNRAITRATGTFFEESYADRWNWSSDIRSAALALDTLIKLRPQSELLPNIARHLVTVREGGGHWRSMQQTTWSIIALTNWMLSSGELAPDFIYSAALNDDQLLANIAMPDNALRDDVLQVELDQLMQDETNILAFQRGDGAGTLYYTAHLNADLPVPALQPISRGIEVSRTYTRLGDETKTPVETVAVGEALQARLQIVAPNTLRYVVIEDYFPAGAEAINPALATSQQIGTMPGGERIDGADGWGWWRFDAIEFHDEKASIYASYLPRGVYEFVYALRPSVAGEYHVIPPTAQEMNFPEVYGRGAGGLLRITD